MLQPVGTFDVPDKEKSIHHLFVTAVVYITPRCYRYLIPDTPSLVCQKLQSPELEPGTSQRIDLESDDNDSHEMMAAMCSGGSLALLNPTPSNLPDRTPRKSSTAQYLEQKTRRIVDYVDNKDFSNPEISELIVQDFKAYLPHSSEPYCSSLDEWLENYRIFAAENPDYFVEVISISASVNEKNGTATVWVLLRITGHPRNLQRENVTVTHWKRNQGQWRAHKQTGMRGFGGLG